MFLFRNNMHNLLDTFLKTNIATENLQQSTFLNFVIALNNKNTFE